MSGSSSSQSLLEIFETLDAERQNTLLQFAEFLQAKGGLVKQDIGEPLPVPRPEKETVVGAIKRLKQTYPMIESMSVFSAASSLMTEHMVNGRDSKEVIDDMQILFEKFYVSLIEQHK